MGVEILGIGATSNLVEGNYIGTDQSGGFRWGTTPGFSSTVRRSTRSAGLSRARQCDRGLHDGVRPGRGSGVGVDIANAGAMDNLVEGNFIGTNETGERALVPSQQPASGVGVLINNTPGSNTIGGVTAAARNVISGFVIAIEIYAPQSPFNLVPGNTVEGDYIGTNALGVVVAGLGNTSGIFVNGVPKNTIGGTAAGPAT